MNLSGDDRTIHNIFSCAHGHIYLWLVVKLSSLSRTQRFTYFQSLCCALEDEREPTIKHCLGRHVDVVHVNITPKMLWEHSEKCEKWQRLRGASSCTSTNSSTECTQCLTCLVRFIHTHIGWSLALTSHPSPRLRGCLSLTRPTPLYFSAFLLSVFLFTFFHLNDEPELCKKIMESLCDSADNGGEGTYDVL